MRRFALMALLPSAALAQSAPDTVAAGSPYASMLPLVLIFVVFYFLLIKPQQKRAKEHQAMLAALKKGDEVVTAGGIVGRVTKVDGERAVVEIAKGVEVAMVTSTITTVLSAVADKPVAANKKNPAVKNDNRGLNKEQIANDN